MRLTVLVAGLALGLGALAAPARADWPMDRHDPARSAATDQRLPAALHLAWTRHLPPQVPAWKDEGRMQFDRSLRPIIAGGLVVVGSNVDDTVTAYRLATGEEAWRWVAGGPVRVAPAAADGRVFVAADDGYLTCLDLETGEVRWRLRGAPRDRRLVGNQRVVATWPCRGGPVVADGVVYVSAGVWPFMGVFVHAVDAASGRILWTNDGTSFSWRRFPHPGAKALSGLSPQGHLALVGDRLLLPDGGDQTPVLDARTGAFLYYVDGGSPTVAGAAPFGFAGGRVFGLEQGRPARIENMGRNDPDVLGPTAWYTSKTVYDPASVRVKKDVMTLSDSHHDPDDTFEKPILTGSIAKHDLGRDARGRPLALAGDTLVLEGKGGLQLVTVGAPGAAPQAAGEVAVEGDPVRALVSDGYLLVVTREGALHCYGPKETEPRTYPLPEATPLDPGAAKGRAEALVQAAGAAEGYALVWGLDDGKLVEGLVAASGLHVVAIDPDATRVAALRERLIAAGVYGRRAAAVVGDPSTVETAPYLAHLVTSEAPARVGLGKDPAAAAALYRSVRPYGGVLAVPKGSAAALLVAADTPLAKAERRAADDWALAVRAGPLPGAADWCGQNADAGNTRVSRDRLVRPPLGVLWWGNALSNSLILPRHGEGPVEQVAGGRLVIEGPDSLSASDVYTGRLLWTREFKGLGTVYNVTKHQRGAHAVGSNFYVVPDAVYVAAGKACHALDPATGKTRKTFTLPGGSDWHFLLVYEDLLIAGAEPTLVEEKGRWNQDGTSAGLVVMDRASGKVLWTRKAAESFSHYGVAAGGGRVYCVDQVSQAERQRLARRGKVPEATELILALDARTGEVQWATDQCLSRQLSYEAASDVLLAKGALRGADGTVIWESPTLKDYPEHPNPGLNSRPNPLWWGKWGPMLRDGLIITQGHRMFDLKTGVQRTVALPGGEVKEWRYRRYHGCGPSAGAWYLITFRSGCAGFYDLLNESGTGNLGGFRSGCTSNLIAAGGVLNAPDYTRTCTCPYQNRSSLGLVHMPEMEYWAFGGFSTPGRGGYNFAAPGDRRDEAGTLWLDTPSIGGPGPALPVAFEPEDVTLRRRHATVLAGGEGHPWVAASCLVGVRKVAVDLAGVGGAGPWTVRLTFAELEDEVTPGERVFDVAVAGTSVAEGLDVVNEAGGPRRSIVREVAGVAATGELVITLTPRSKRPPILAGLEVLASDAPGSPAVARQ